MGFFSWLTNDTKRSISNRYSVIGAFPVYMVNPVTGEFYEEKNYEGYGVFGGKDFYELLAEINGKTSREEGIELAFGKEKYLSPLLVENLSKWKKFKGEIPADCKVQGYFYYADDDEE